MKKSKKIAFCGIISSLAIVLMLLTGLFPFMSYALPAIAGALFILVVIEMDIKWAILAYVVVSLLSLIIAPDLLAKIIFIVFFGYYPIVKSVFEKRKSKVLMWSFKLGTLNLAMAATYALTMYVFKLDQVIQETSQTAILGTLGFWLLANVTFVIYDKLLSRLIGIYLNKYRKYIIK